MKYRIKISQEVVHEPVREGDKEWTSCEELDGCTDSFEDVNAMIGLVTQIFPNAEITISTNNKEEE